jgi:hypothetical protein
MCFATIAEKQELPSFLSITGKPFRSLEFLTLFDNSTVLVGTTLITTMIESEL